MAHSKTSHMSTQTSSRFLNHQDDENDLEDDAEELSSSTLPYRVRFDDEIPQTYSSYYFHNNKPPITRRAPLTSHNSLSRADEILINNFRPFVGVASNPSTSSSSSSSCFDTAATSVGLRNSNSTADITKTSPYRNYLDSNSSRLNKLTDYAPASSYGGLSGNSYSQYSKSNGNIYSLGTTTTIRPGFDCRTTSPYRDHHVISPEGNLEYSISFFLLLIF